MSRTPTLIEQVQRLLERTYRMQTVGLDVSRFLIGDAGYHRLYGGREPLHVAGSASERGSRTLIRETEQELRASIYFPDRLIQKLEQHPPQRGLNDSNVDPFATMVEELDHLLYVADRAARGQEVSLFELELHANISKYLVLARYLAGRRPGLCPERRTWLRYHLFEKLSFTESDPRLLERYQDAQRFAVRFLERFAGCSPRRVVAALRQFHQATVASKLRLIESI